MASHKHTHTHTDTNTAYRCPPSLNQLWHHTKTHTHTHKHTHTPTHTAYRWPPSLYQLWHHENTHTQTHLIGSPLPSPHSTKNRAHAQPHTHTQLLHPPSLTLSHDEIRNKSPSKRRQPARPWPTPPCTSVAN